MSPQRRLHFAVTGGPGNHNVTGLIEVSAEVWHHVCGTYDGSHIRLYADGVEDPASPVAYDDGITTNYEPVYIGANSEALGQYPLDGCIDDVHVYSRALRPEEVKALYEHARPAKEPRPQ
jgi:beta-galactosidase